MNDRKVIWMDKKKTTLAIIAILTVLVSSIPFPGLYALWGFLAFVWWIGRINPGNTKENVVNEGKS